MAHPLSDFVLSAFTPEEAHHDATTISVFLAGSTYARIPKRKVNVMRAYLLVAEHVLGSLVEDGRLEIERPSGWYVTKHSANKPTDT